MQKENMKTRPNKYNAKKTVVDGITFDSKKEAKRYQELKLLERAGEIDNLELQPVYQLTVASMNSDQFSTVGKYIADFRYSKMDYGIKYPGLDRCIIKVVEDVKGVKTPLYRLKKKLMKAIYGIDILET